MQIVDFVLRGDHIALDALLKATGLAGSGGQAKAMVVTDSRVAAVRYKKAFDDYIRKQGHADCRALVAYSGEVTDEESNVLKAKELTAEARKRWESIVSGLK